MRPHPFQDIALRYFLEVAHTGSVTEASERLHVAASAISRQIGALEQSLGSPLFERHSRGLVLNAAGDILLRHARRAILDAEQVVEEIRSLQGMRIGKVRLAATEGFANEFLPRVVADFRQDHPGIVFELNVVPHVVVSESVRRGDVDIGRKFSRGPEKDIKVEYHQPAPVLALLPRGHPMAGKRAITLKQMQPYPIRGCTTKQRTIWMSQAEKGDNVRAVGRTLEILLAFTPRDCELSAGELLKRVDPSRPTLYRLLYTLQEYGLLVSVGEPQRFRLGPSVAKLTHTWTAGLSMTTIAEPFLRKSWEETGETVASFVPQEASRLCIAELPSPQPLSFRRGVGYTERIVRGATGRAILAFMQTTPQQLHKYLQDSAVDAKALELELVQTRKRGYAISRREFIQGAVAIAVPFFDRNALVAGSIGVFGPEVRLNNARQQQIAELLIDQAFKLSEALGCGNVARARA